MKSRRIFKIILITAVLVIVLSIPAFATAKNGVVKSKANVRNGPGTSYSLVYKDLPANTQIIIIDRVKCNDGTTSNLITAVSFTKTVIFQQDLLQLQATAVSRTKSPNSIKAI